MANGRKIPGAAEEEISTALRGSFFRAGLGTPLIPRPVHAAHQPFQKCAEDGCHVVEIHWRAQHQGVRAVDLVEDRRHIVVDRTLASRLACRQGAGAAIAAVFNVLVDEINLVRLCPVLACPGQHGIHRRVHRAALAIAADDCHYFLRHGLS